MYTYRNHKKAKESRWGKRLEVGDNLFLMDFNTWKPLYLANPRGWYVYENIIESYLIPEYADIYGRYYYVKFTDKRSYKMWRHFLKQMNNIMDNANNFAGIQNFADLIKREAQL